MSYDLLRTLTEPNDLHKLSTKELRQVADELRQAILDQVSKVGGHFSSNLGTVELTVAMYASYRMPPDVVVWDTGHQAYPHKMLTGRLDRFSTLRQYKGLSGFLKRDEHPLDSFGAGHAGTAISAALGFAIGRDQRGEQHKVVAVTGDAAIGAGMCWEALNHAGELGTDLHVVLNDNRFSIAPNVGALSNYFARLRSRPLVQDLAYRAKDIMDKMPSPVGRVAKGLRHGVTHFFAPEETGTIFEEMGFEYIGPVDGHDLPVLLEVFRNVREARRPVFVHALTVKGKGYQVAEADACKWHGVVPFDPGTNEMPKGASGPVSYTGAFSSALCEIAKDDPTVVAITAAMPDGTGLSRFQREFPDRYVDVGIAEQHAVTFAAGLAATGVKPFCAIYSTFLQRGFDQVLHDVAIQHLPVRFCMDRAGLVGADGPTHHGTFDISFLGLIPGLVLMAPRDATELGEMLRWMAGFNDGPSAVRYPRGNTDDRLPEGRTPIELGRAEVLGSPSGAKETRVTLAAVGSMVAEAWVAAMALEQNGIPTSVVNARFIKPLDLDTLIQTIGCGALVTVEENVRWGGYGQQVRDGLEERGVHVPTRLLAVPDQFVEHGDVKQLRADCGLDAAGIARAAESLVRSAAKLV